MNYSGNMPDWHQYNPPQAGRTPTSSSTSPGSSSSASTSSVVQNASNHIFLSSLNPGPLDGINLSADRHRLAGAPTGSSATGVPIGGLGGKTDVSYPRNYPITPGISSSLQNCHYGTTLTRNPMMDSGMDPRLSVVGSSGHEEAAHRSAGQMSFVAGCHPGNSLGVNGAQNASLGSPGRVPGSQPGYVTCKAPCCNPDGNLSYQHWEKYGQYANGAYRENIRQPIAYPMDNRRYIGEMPSLGRKDCPEAKEHIDPGSNACSTYGIDHRTRNFIDYSKYPGRKDMPSRAYPTPSVHGNYQMGNYNFSAEYQKCLYSGKDYPRRGLNPMNGGPVNAKVASPVVQKYPEQPSVIIQQKYSKQYRNPGLSTGSSGLQNNNMTPSNPTNPSSNNNNPTGNNSTGNSSMANLHNSYYNGAQMHDYSRDYQPQEPSRIVQNTAVSPGTVPQTANPAFPKYQHMYQQKIAMQRFSMENHLRALSRIPGYQSHPKYQESVMRYREILRLQQTVEYQSLMHENSSKVSSSPGGGNVVAPINLQYDQNGVLINSSYMGTYGISGMPVSSATTPTAAPTTPRPEMAGNEILDRSIIVQGPNVGANEGYEAPTSYHQEQTDQASPRVPTHEENSYYVLEEKRKSEEKSRERGEQPPVCDSSLKTSGEIGVAVEEYQENPKEFADKPQLDVRQFLANWDEDEDTTTTEINVENEDFSGTNANDQSSPEEETNAGNSVRIEISKDDTGQEIILKDIREIDCISDEAEMDAIPTIHIVESLDEGTEIEKIQTVFGNLTSTVLNPIGTEDTTSIGPTSGSAETIVLYGEPEVSPKCLEFRLPAACTSVIASVDSQDNITEDKSPYPQENPDNLPRDMPEQIAQSIPISTGPTKIDSKIDSTNLRKQNSFTSDESHNPDDISLPDLQTSECTPMSTTLNTPIQSDSEESTENVSDLTISTNPIEIIQNSPIISFTHSPIKIEPYEQLNGSRLIEGHSGTATSEETGNSLDFDFDEAVASTENRKYNDDCESASPASVVEELENQARDQLLSQKAKNSSENNDFYNDSLVIGMDKTDFEPAKNSSEEVEPSELLDKCTVVAENPAENDSADNFTRPNDLEKLCDISLDASCMIPLIPNSEETEEPRMPVSPMEGNCLTKILNDTLPITDLDMLESNETIDKPVDDIWAEVENFDDNSSSKYLKIGKNPFKVVAKNSEKIIGEKGKNSYEEKDRFNDLERSGPTESEVMVDVRASKEPEVQDFCADDPRQRIDDALGRKSSREETVEIGREIGDRKCEERPRDANVAIQVANLNVKIHNELENVNREMIDDTIATADGLDGIEIKINLSRDEIGRIINKSLKEKFHEGEERDAEATEFRPEDERKKKKRYRRRRRSLPEVGNDFETKRSRKIFHDDSCDESSPIIKRIAKYRGIANSSTPRKNRKIRRSLDEDSLPMNQERVRKNFHFRGPMNDEPRPEVCKNRYRDLENIANKFPKQDLHFSKTYETDLGDEEEAETELAEPEENEAKDDSEKKSVKFDSRHEKRSNRLPIATYRNYLTPETSINFDNYDNFDVDSIRESDEEESPRTSFLKEPRSSRLRDDRYDSVIDKRNTVPIFTTKDGRIKYSPNANYSYCHSIGEARTRERRYSSDNRKFQAHYSRSRTNYRDAGSRRIHKRRSGSRGLGEGEGEKKYLQSVKSKRPRPEARESGRSRIHEARRDPEIPSDLDIYPNYEKKREPEVASEVEQEKMARSSLKPLEKEEIEGSDREDSRSLPGMRKKSKNEGETLILGAERPPSDDPVEPKIFQDQQDFETFSGRKIERPLAIRRPRDDRETFYPEDVVKIAASPSILDKRPLGWEHECHNALSDSGLESSTTYVEASKQSRKIHKWKNSFVDRVESAKFSLERDKKDDCKDETTCSTIVEPFFDASRDDKQLESRNPNRGKILDDRLSIEDTDDSLAKNCLRIIDDRYYTKNQLKNDLAGLIRRTDDQFAIYPKEKQEMVETNSEKVDDDRSTICQEENTAGEEIRKTEDRLSMANKKNDESKSKHRETVIDYRFSANQEETNHRKEKYRSPTLDDPSTIRQRVNEYEKGDPKNENNGKIIGDDIPMSQVENKKKNSSQPMEDRPSTPKGEKIVFKDRSRDTVIDYSLSQAKEDTSDPTDSKTTDDRLSPCQNEKKDPAPLKHRSEKPNEQLTIFQQEKKDSGLEQMEKTKEILDKGSTYEQQYPNRTINSLDLAMSRVSNSSEEIEKCKKGKTRGKSDEKIVRRSSIFRRSHSADAAICPEYPIVQTSPKDIGRMDDVPLAPLETSWPEVTKVDLEPKDEITMSQDPDERCRTPEMSNQSCKYYLIDSCTNFSSCMKLPDPLSDFPEESEASRLEDTSTRFASESMDFTDPGAGSDATEKSHSSTEPPILTFSGQIQQDIVLIDSKSPPDLTNENSSPKIAPTSPVVAREDTSGNDEKIQPKIPKMIIRNYRSRPATPTDDSHNANSRLSTNDGVFEIAEKFDAGEEAKIPKMKIRLEENFRAENSSRSRTKKVRKNSNSPMMTPEKQPLVGKLSRQSSENELFSPDVQEKSDMYKFTLLEKSTNHNNHDSQHHHHHHHRSKDAKMTSEDAKHEKIPKFTIKKHSGPMSSSKKRGSPSPTVESMKKRKKHCSSAAKTESEDPEKRPSSLENEDSHQSSSAEKIPKVIIKRASPSAEFKCELSKTDAIIKDSKWQPEVKLRRFWVLDCMAKEPGNGQVALKVLESTINDVVEEKETPSACKIASRKWKRSSTDSLYTRSSFSEDKTTEKSAFDLSRCKTRRKSLDNIDFRQEIRGNFENLGFSSVAKKEVPAVSMDDRTMISTEENNGDTKLRHKIDDFPEEKKHFRVIGCQVDPGDKVKVSRAPGEFHDENTVIKLDSSDESQTTIEILPASPATVSQELENTTATTISSSNGQQYYQVDDCHMAKLYSDEAIPTQFELELEIVDNSSVDTFQVPGPPGPVHHVIRSQGDNRNADDYEDLATDLGCELFNDESRKIREKRNQRKLCCSDSLVKEVLAAKETLKRCLATKNVLGREIPRTKTAAEKKQGYDDFTKPWKSLKTQEDAKSSSRISSGSQEKVKKTSQLTTSVQKDGEKSSRRSRTDEKRAHSGQGRSKDESGSKRNSTRSSPSKSSKSSERPGEHSRSSGQKSSRTTEKRDHPGPKITALGQTAIVSGGSSSSSSHGIKSYKIPKISSSSLSSSSATSSSSRERKTEPKVIDKTRKSPSPVKMPVLEPQTNFDLNRESDRDASRSPPVITKQEEIVNEPKVLHPEIDKVVLCEKLDAIEKKPCDAESVSFADIVSQLAYHEKATIRHRRYCTLCERWFPTAARHRRHLTGYQHRHTELTQRRTVHALFMLFTGKPCPRLLPASIVRTDCLPGEPTPLQIAVQDVAMSVEDVGPPKPSEKDVKSDDVREYTARRDSASH